MTQLVFFNAIKPKKGVPLQYIEHHKIKWDKDLNFWIYEKHQETVVTDTN